MIGRWSCARARVTNEGVVTDIDRQANDLVTIAKAVQIVAVQSSLDRWGGVSTP
jgi:hypothetical protein